MDREESTVGEQRSPHDAEDEPCPVCGEAVNHVVPNGYRNVWDHSVAKVAVCTTAGSDWMYVHVTEVQ